MQEIITKLQDILQEIEDLKESVDFDKELDEAQGYIGSAILSVENVIKAQG